MSYRKEPYPELSVVRTHSPKSDDRGRPVPVGSSGTIVHVYPTRPDQEPRYIVEVVIAGPDGMQVDAHIFDAVHHELDLQQS